MNSVNLIDVLPWGDHPPISNRSRTTLICDSVETDGRFMLYTIALQCLTSSHTSKDSSGVSSSAASPKITPIAWINCGTHTEDQIRSAMKKIGCDVRTSGGVEIINVNSMFLVESALVDAKTKERYSGDILKTVFLKVSSIVKYQKEVLIVVDDATTLSTIFGVPKALGFLQSLRSLLQRKPLHCEGGEFNPQKNGLVIRISHDLDQEQFYQNQTAIDTSVTGNKSLNYIGAGGRAVSSNISFGNSDLQISSLETNCAYELNSVAWERILVEIADGIVDVLPLTSGFSKDVHGRLIFTQRLGGLGWKDGNDIIISQISDSGIRDGSNDNRSSFSTNMVNYCCSDAGVRAIRLRV